MRIIELQADSFKRLRAVRIRPEQAVTAVIGPNGAGKTSVLDAIAAALGGAAEAPEVPIRRGSDAAQVILDLGEIKVRRRWTAKGSSLEVTTADGAKYPRPQDVLDKLVGQLSFDPLEFSRMKPADQAATLARVAGVDLAAHQVRRKQVFDERTYVNRQAKDARARVDATPDVAAPAEEVSVATLVTELEQAEGVNRVKAGLAERHKAAVQTESSTKAEVDRATGRVRKLEEELLAARSALLTAEKTYQTAVETTIAAGNRWEAAPTADTTPIRQKLASAEQDNTLVRQRRERERAAVEAAELEKKADLLTGKLETLDDQLEAAVAQANLPVPGLTLQPEGVRLAGIPFSQCSGAEKLRVSVALGLALNPKLRLMLIRDGSLLDAGSMKLLAELAEGADAQVLIERVDGTGEVGVRIEDGEVIEAAIGERGAA